MARASRARTLKILASIPKAIRDEVRKTIEAEAAAVVATQKRLVSKKSGALAKSIRYVMGDVALASSGNLSAGGGARSRGSRTGGSAGGVVRGDPDLSATLVAGDREAWMARLVEFGSKAHVIRPKNTQGSLSINGRWLPPGEAVDHPGARPHPFFYGPFRAAKKRIKRRVSSAIGKAVKKAASS